MGARKDKAEPEYITSLVIQKPIEMIQARKIAWLILLKRGWVFKHSHFHPPERFKSWRESFVRNDPGRYRFASLRILTPVSAISEWKRLGMTKTVEFVDCQIVRRLILTPAGEDLLMRLAPEMLAEARAIVRAAIWTDMVLGRRRAVKRAAQIEKMRSEIESPPQNKKRKQNVKHKT